MNSSSSIPKTRIQFFIGLLIFFQADMPDLKGQSYCIPGSSICSDYRNLRIDSVAFGTIHNVSGCGVNGYTDYTSNVKPANITAGTYVPVYVKSGNSPFSNKNVIMAIDFNHNGKFDADEITSLNSVGASASASVRIPFTSLEGNTRMRITIGDFSGEMAMCNNTGYGETEDYLINILPAETPGSGFTFYVNKSAAGTSDGLSWANAFTSISEAMYYAKGRDTIKVAKGYYIQKSTLNIKDSIILKGGYPDTGTPSDKDRDFSRNQTIVTGKPENYQFPFDNLTILFRAIQYASSIKMNFMIDGFIFENAYSNALYVQSATSAEIRNCVFRENNSSTEGAALNCINSKIIIANCFFDSNNYTSAKTIINCTENSSTEFTNCVFSNNAGSNGVVYTNQSTSSFTNCSFVNNWNYYKTIFADNYSTVRIKNSIFYNNRSVNSLDSSEIQLTSSVAIVSNTITQGYDYGNSNLFAKNPKFNDVTNIAGNDNLYFTKDDGLQLINPCSPAINAGLNQSIAGVENDILGNQRIFGSQVDLGAYEVQSEITEIPGTLYVNKRATGANDGSSWADAFTDLQRALHFCSDTIRIAAGSYVPSESDETASFILQNKRVILGGYPDTGNPTESQRNPSKYPTILTGNLPNGKQGEIILKGKNLDSSTVVDGINIMNAGSFYRNTGAVYLVAGANAYFTNCTFKDNNLPGLVANNSSPKIVNCTFENNQSSGNGSSGGASNFNNSRTHFINCLFKGNINNINTSGRSAGGAVLNFDSDAVFDSCTFLRNIVNNNGGAMANINSNPLINNCKFISNIVYADFGGYANDIYNNHSSPKIFNSFFQDSTASIKGGSIANINSSSPVFTRCEFKNGFASKGGVCYNDESSPQFINCVFHHSGSGSGGVVYNANLSTPRIINCIATDNSANAGGFMYNENSDAVIINSTIVNNTGSVFVNNAPSILSIYNCIIWGNNVNPGGAEITGDPIGSVEIKNSITQTYGINGANGNMVGINPKLINISNPAGPDSLFFTADDGVNLCNCSPAINKGLNSVVSEFTTDISGAKRIYDGIVDIGAYELQSAAVSGPQTYFVNASATGANDGSSWNNAYKELKTAIENTCSDTIKVAMGTYKPAQKARDSAFNINRGLVIIGGYPNSGQANDALRNTDLYPTILSGDIGIEGDSTDNSYNIMKINCPDTTVNIQGLTFKFGSATALYASVNKHSVISNCRFYHNYSEVGGAIYANKNVLIEKCVFSDNNGRWGGALYVSGENVVVKNSVFNNNFGSLGAAVFCSSNAIFENTLFYKNTTNYTGAGVYIDGNQFAKFINCNFVKNNVIGTGTGTGTDLFFSYSGSMFSNPIIVNCIFKDNMIFGIKNENKHTDWAWVKSGNYASEYELNIQNSAVKTFVNYYENNISSANASFRNIEDAIGPDGLWFTDDDGLIPDACSQTADKGDNASAENIHTDILQNSRIYNGTVDIGAYEFTGTFKPLLMIVASDSVICSGTRVTFNAKPTTGGSSPSFQWMINDVKTGSDSAIFTSSSLKQGDKVKCILTSSSECVTSKSAESNTVTISISSSISPEVAITGSADKVCKGAPLTFKAISRNAGPNPIYQWQVNNINAGNDNVEFVTSGLQNLDQVRVIVTSSFSCASPSQVTSNPVSISVITPPVAHAGKDTTICMGTFAELNGSGGNFYHWAPSYNLTNPNIANPRATPQTSTVYHVTVSNDGVCFSSDSLTVYVKEPVVTSVNISAQTDSICSGEPALFSATSVNGGTSPFYQWQVNASDVQGNGVHFTSSSLKDQDYIRVILTSSLQCAIPSSSNEMAIAIVQLQTPSIVLINKKVIITNRQADAIYSLQFLNGNQWFDVASFSSDSSSIIVEEGMYRVKATKGICTRFSNELSSKLPGSAPEGILIYPNPTKGNLYIDSLSGNWQSIEIFNLQGRRVLPVFDVRNQASVVIHLENLASGYYIIKIINKEGEKKQFKFIKQ